MRQPSDIEIKNRLGFDNPWWASVDWLAPERKAWPKRAYFNAFADQVSLTSIRRAVVLMGPRRVGKTVMIRQTIQHLIDEGVDPKSILYCSLETPVYIGLGLERLFRLFCETHGHDLMAPLYVFFDEIQYLKHWEVHLKSFVDSFAGTKAVASGSAAAALRYASNESGAGRFTDFILPPLSFAEFLDFTLTDEEKDRFEGITPDLKRPSIEVLNAKLIDYLNFGGFPEVLFDSRIRTGFEAFVGEDVISKVMLRDLPSLYGIDDPQELSQFFALLAFNSGAEVNIDSLSQKSGASMNTIRKYLQYLEAAFLIRRVDRIDRKARAFKRASTFKVYLTNPCLRAALFGPISEASPEFGAMVETALFASLTEAGRGSAIKYARWDKGEVDFVLVNMVGRPEIAYECKWSDSIFDDLRNLKPYIDFTKSNDLEGVVVSSKTIAWTQKIDDQWVNVRPAALLIFQYGRQIGARVAMGEVPGIDSRGAQTWRSPIRLKSSNPQ